MSILPTSWAAPPFDLLDPAPGNRGPAIAPAIWREPSDPGVRISRFDRFDEHPEKVLFACSSCNLDRYETDQEERQDGRRPADVEAVV